jgi:hypothetical protein
MSEIEDKLALCERRIADLTERIAAAKSRVEGSGVIAAQDLIEMLERTLQSWLETKQRISDVGDTAR